MQLSKLYSNQPNFKNIEFNLNGLNVIYAEVKSKFAEKKNSHDLGKTKLAELIDFLFLKEIDKKHFLLKVKRDGKSIFEDYIFYLEIYLNSGKYLTIKRGVSENTKISISIHEQTTNSFTPPSTWEHEKLAIKRAKDILSMSFALDFFENKPYNYRKAISYSIRKQDDFNDVYKLNKFSAGRDIDWKPFMFDLLGFDGELLKQKYQNDNKIEDIKEFVKNLKKEYSVNVENRDTIVAEKSIVETDFQEIEKQIDRFDFYEQDKRLIKEGIEEIESEISELNTISYQLNFEIEKLQSSIKNNFSFDIKKVEQVFKETETYFPEKLAADYSELMEFNYKLTTERNKLLKTTLKFKNEELSHVNEQLVLFNKQREELLSSLTDSDTFSKFKTYQKELVKVEGKLLAIDDKLKAIDKIISKEKDIDTLKEEIKSTTKKLKEVFQTTDVNDKYKLVRSNFTRLYKTVMNENALLSWNINKEDNVEFIPPKVKSVDNQEDTAKDEGNTYMKLLCVAFDLAILITYNKESYYRFVYHDDVLSQQDNGIKTRLLGLVDSIIKESKLQYILSVIKSDLPVDEDEKFVEFSDEQIVLRLDDKDPSGTLFGFEF